ncbi:MAG TPA: FliM/FliN family flagellar motor C-terminal domain-containing protein [Limnochordia bacterium]|nr:FliM/FliN family flagellar motor C-terminal domain-containing protein [Limnochordia bacterium]
MSASFLSKEELDALLHALPAADAADGEGYAATAEWLCRAVDRALGAVELRLGGLTVCECSLVSAGALAFQTRGQAFLWLLLVDGRVVGPGAARIGQTLLDQLRAHDPRQVERRFVTALAAAMSEVAGRRIELRSEMRSIQEALPPFLAAEPELVYIGIGADRPLLELALPLDVAAELADTVGRGERVPAVDHEAAAGVDVDVAEPAPPEAEAVVEIATEPLVEPEAAATAPVPELPNDDALARLRPIEVPRTVVQSPPGPRLNWLREVKTSIRVELGHAELRVAELMRLQPGATIELTPQPGNLAKLYIDDQLIARGDPIRLPDGRITVRLVEINEPEG